jgi:thiamine biosynthesis lipoprotein
MRLNAAPVGAWVAVPERLREVRRLGLEIGPASDGAFDIGMGDAVIAWCFGPVTAASERICAAMRAERRRAHEALEIDARNGCVQKKASVAPDLAGC